MTDKELRAGPELPWASAQYPEDSLKAARFLAASLGVSRSAVLRIALEEYIDRHWTDELRAALAAADEFAGESDDRAFRSR